MRHGLFEEARRFRCAAALGAALCATACEEVPPCTHCGPGELDSSDTCGVFAKASDGTGGLGTSEQPYASLQEAIDRAASMTEGRTVCACAGKAFTEAVTLRAGIEVRGDYTCDEAWKESPGTKSTIEGPPGQVALTLTEAAAGAIVQGFEIKAAPATELGGSSIAVAVADIAATLKQVKAVAGDAMNGANGEAPAGTAAAGKDAPAGDAANACVDAPKGGDPGATTCGIEDTSGGAGGPGGTADLVDGIAGVDGKPMLEAMQTGKGGLVRDGYGGIGLPGAPGGPGQSGSGGKDATLALAGVLGGDGAPGRTGIPGQGGGGGGGANAMNFCPQRDGTLRMGTGASGGGGGAGGCGGAGGTGGKAGGSSIAIVSLGTLLVLDEVSVEVGNAGDGGNGAAGQPGGAGGQGAAGGRGTYSLNVDYAGAGGNGGRGGPGGPGGGGRGGYAIGIAYAGAAPDRTPSFDSFPHGREGLGGQDGMGSSAEAGKSGGAAACWRFDTHKNCAE
ncbi:hypothetical protein AB3662_04190 [Sorangium cellulosum]|uniref:hypothetical protein n=1 Tax=Sorangium cellulosum TaxID=56 RepID=UPI003D9A9F23